MPEKIEDIEIQLLLEPYIRGTTMIFALRKASSNGA